MLSNTFLFTDLAEHAEKHSRTSDWWKETDIKVREELDEVFLNGHVTLSLGDLGPLKIQNTSFGSIESKHLFGLDELIIFAWYARNQKRYSKTLDLGANVGVHSLIMSKFGFEVTAYEPDPSHLKLFQSHLKENAISTVDLRPRAIADQKGTMNFTRVVGNTTGSHLSGAKKNLYGELEEFPVDVDAFQKVIEEGFDFIKIDVEGFEANLLQSLRPEQLGSTEIMLEVGSEENARIVWNEIARLGVYAYSQKENWNRASSLSAIPQSYKEGSLFISKNSEMSWR